MRRVGIHHQKPHDNIDVFGQTVPKNHGEIEPRACTHHQKPHDNIDIFGQKVPKSNGEIEPRA